MRIRRCVAPNQSVQMKETTGVETFRRKLNLRWPVSKTQSIILTNSTVPAHKFNYMSMKEVSVPASSENNLRRRWQQEANRIIERFTTLIFFDFVSTIWTAWFLFWVGPWSLSHKWLTEQAKVIIIFRLSHLIDSNRVLQTLLDTDQRSADDPWL